MIRIPFALLLLLSAALFAFREDDPKKPEANRFTPVVLTPEGALDEPMAFEVLKDGSAYVIEHRGGFKKYDPITQTVRLIATIPVYPEHEQGLVGFTLDPNFVKNHWIYLYYAHPTESKMMLTRWDLVNDKLIENSRKVLLNIPVDREGTNHTGGGMTWDARGNLYLTVGNNSGNSYFSQTDERPGHQKGDDQRGAANTNDLRGKILRIHPTTDVATTDVAESNGTYSIPEGNLFPKSTPNGSGQPTRPEIYVMGTRNAWRPSIDSQTGWLYWGEIGPDADKDTENGPRGYDEFNQARKPGFFGWPYFIGDNYAYPKYDYATNKPGPKPAPDAPVNTSPNNTGLNQLPPAQPAFIYYPYAVSEKFPLVGSSSRAAIGGPVYRRADFPNPKRPFPAYYEGKWLAADLSRFWIMAIRMDANGNYQSMEPFAPDYHPRQPIDLKFGPDGDLYVLEYGGSTSRSPLEARLVRIEYNAGNRKPLVHASASKRGGAIPLRVTLTSAGTKDYDGDALTYEWKVTTPGSAPRTFRTANPVVTFDKAAVYTATLTVTDAKGAKNSQAIKIVAGNEPPVVSLALGGNTNFFFANKPISYLVDVVDKEDGRLNAKIDPAQVAVSIDYASPGFDFVDIVLNQQRVDASTRFAVARAMMRKSDCNTCHNTTAKGVGPSFRQIARKYQAEPDAQDRLAGKIRNGGAGVWGQTAMPAHPTLTPNDTRTMVDYILKIETKTISTLPVEGTYTTRIPEGDAGKGTYILRAAYTDRPTNVPAQTSEAVVILRSPQLIPTEADVIQGAVRDQLDEYTFLTTKANSYIGFKTIDLTGIKQVEFRPNWHLYDIYLGGFVEIRLDSPTGEVLAKTEIREEQFNIKKMPGGMNNFWAGLNGKDKNSKTIPSKVALKAVSGVHDLYFIFKNEKATANQALFPLSSITFYDEVN
ncbi:MAG: PQQ-dependent sugar dehydrogenase [Cytophagaceae bacterium]|nr:PQQ-dependent sugar dehydrogenase [Cytophagaceae bacterium]